MAIATLNITSGSDDDMDFIIPCFLEEEEDGVCCSSCSPPHLSDDCGSDGESSGVNPFDGEQVRQMLQGISSSTTGLEQMLHREVAKAIGLAKQKAGVSIQNEAQKSSLRRFVMSSLRCAGYNATICKSRWEKTNGYPAGDYEFVDVVVEGSRSMVKGDRLLVDIDFRAQFEIARPTDEYCALVEVLPTLFVGSGDKLREIVMIMCEGAKISLKAKGMHIPPWRKYRYVQAKWLGPFKRTTHAASTSTGPGGRHLPVEYVGVTAVKGMKMGWEACFTDQG